MESNLWILYTNFLKYKEEQEKMINMFSEGPCKNPYHVPLELYGVFALCNVFSGMWPVWFGLHNLRYVKQV